LAFAILLDLEIEFYICPWHKNAAGAFAPAAVLLIWIFSTPTIDVEPKQIPIRMTETSGWGFFCLFSGSKSP
jgi:hypothetical protein